MRRPAGIVTRSLSASVASRPTPHSAPVPPPAVATNRPTSEFHRHHDVTAPQVDANAFRQGWRVATRLDGLLEAGRIDREAWDAAQEWRRWAGMVTPYKMQRWEVRVDQSPVATADTGMLKRVNAAMRLRQVAEALGELRVRLLELCIVRDASWREVGARLRMDPKSAQVRVVEAIEALADWRNGRTVAPPPLLRYRNQPGSL